MPCPHVLVVDDDMLARAVLRTIKPVLRDVHLKERTEAAEKALEMVLARPKDNWLIISGQILEGRMTGLDLLTLVRNVEPPIRAFMVLISVSADTLKDDRRIASANALLLKPYVSEELRKHVATWVESLSSSPSL